MAGVPPELTKVVWERIGPVSTSRFCKVRAGCFAGMLVPGALQCRREFCRILHKVARPDEGRCSARGGQATALQLIAGASGSNRWLTTWRPGVLGGEVPLTAWRRASAGRGIQSRCFKRDQGLSERSDWLGGL